MRILKTAWFVRFTRTEGIDDAVLLECADRANLGLTHARLGGGLVKQRIARRGQGGSGGYRGILAFRAGHLAVFLYGYAKKDRSDSRPDEVAQLKKLAKHLLRLTNDQLDDLVARNGLEEVTYGGAEVRE